MGNEGQDESLSGQGSTEQQGYYGWQYDQDATQIAPPRRAGNPRRSSVPSSSASQSPAPVRETPNERELERTRQYQQPIQDMGMTLSFGPGSEYQYFDVPQPSQPIAQLRQERLQQLREERMRRQLRRMRPDMTSIFPWSNKGGLPTDDRPAAPPGAPRDGLSAAPPSSGISTTSSRFPRISLPLRPGGDVAPVRSSTLPPDGLDLNSRGSAPANNAGLQPAASAAQDTGMLQKVRIGRATFILTIAFVLSRVLGLVRTSMFAFVFGTSGVSDAYLQAFLIPDFIFNVVSGGALGSAFIPVFTGYMIGDKDEKSAWHVASAALNLALAIMGTLALVAIIFARQLVPLYNPDVDPQQLDLIANLTRIMLLQSVLLGGGVIVTSVLNAQQDFKLPAIGTVTYNAGLILGLLPGLFLAVVGHRNDTLAVNFATWGVVAGAALQVGTQIPGLIRLKMPYTFVLDWRHPGVIQIGRQMLPRIFNAAMIYLSTFVDRSLILLLGSIAGAAAVDGSITQYYQALQIMLLPYGIFGLSVATAAFPTLAENVTKGRFDRVRNTVLETLRSIIALSVPSSVALIVLALPVIQVLLQHGRYQLSDAQSTAYPLAFFSVGMLGMASVEILTRSFYAMRDTKTPVIVSIIQFAFKIALSLVLINVAYFGIQWGVGALAFSTSIASTLEAIALFWLLNQRIGDLQVMVLLRFIGRVLLAALAMAITLLVIRLILDNILVTDRTQSMGLPGTIMAMVKLLIEVFAGLFVYIRCARMLGINEELAPVKRLLGRLKLSWI